MIALLTREAGGEQHPLFIDYGQLCGEREWEACQTVHQRFNLPTPERMNLAGFGRLVRSGLTDARMRVNEDAFTPGRNLLFLLAGASYAYQKGARSVTIGLLSEDTHLFPDQTRDFLERAQETIRFAMGFDVTVVAPLMRFSKLEVLELARQKGLAGTYSCHAGTPEPCGKCISCLEAGAGPHREAI